MAIKGILLGILFFLTAFLLISVSSYLIVEFWIPLNEYEINDKPVYTFAMFCLFGWIITIIFTLIFCAAGARAFVQRNNEDMGISKGVTGTAMVITALIGGSMIIWYILFQELAFFSMQA